MGIKDWYGKHFKNQTDSKTHKSEEQTLAQKGIQIISDGKLENRVALLIDLEDEINKEIQTENLATYVKTLKERTDLLNHGILQIALPFARAGTYSEYARKLRGWTQMYSLAQSWILQAQKMIPQKQQPNNKEGDTIDNDNIEIQVHMMHDNLGKFIFKDAFYFLGVCFMDVDIAPTAATVVQTMVQPRGGEGLNAIAQPSTEY